MAECVLCLGSGDCLNCDGTGLEGGLIKGADCLSCSGSGVCPQCGGCGEDDKDNWDK